MITLAVLGSGQHANQTANRLTAAHYPVRTWGIKEANASETRWTAHPTPRDAAAGAGMLLTFIEDLDELHEVLTHPAAGALEALAPGAWWLNLAPVHGGAGRELRDLAHLNHVAYQHTPIYGANGNLVVIGPSADDHCSRAVCDTILGHIGPVIPNGTEASHLALAALPRVVSAEPALDVLGRQLWDIEASMLEDSWSLAHKH